ncbi:MAG: tyrosine-type recombinase/integrase [Christensenellaceae bacterium]
MKFENWLNEWLEWYVKPTAKPRTYRKYRQVVQDRLLPALGEYELSELTPSRLQRFTALLAEENLAPNTVNLFLAVLRSALRRAVALGITEREHTSAIVRPKLRERKIECFSKDEQRKIEDYIIKKKQSKLFGILLCLYTGLRIGELLALQWEDIELKKGMISVTKTCRDGWENGKYVKIVETPKTAHSQRVIPIPKQLLPIFRELRKGSSGSYLVDANSVCGAEVRSYQRTFGLLLKRLNIPHRGFHCLRHTFATRALECGMDVKTLSEILGHADASITLKRYAHSMLEHKREMMNRIGKFLI